MVFFHLHNFINSKDFTITIRMKRIHTSKELKEEIKRLSRQMECEEVIELRLSTNNLMMKATEHIISHGLSLIDAYQFKDEYVIKITNRFTGKCKEGRK